MSGDAGSHSVFVHESAVVDDGAVLGPGTFVWHFTHIMKGAVVGADVVIGQNGYVAGSVVVGDRCRIQNNVSLYDGVQLEDGVFVGPSVVFTNVRRPRADFPRKDAFDETLVKSGATLGANCTVVCGCIIGRGAMIAAGAVVNSDVPDFALMVGVPARWSGAVCLCGEALTLPEIRSVCSIHCESCSRRYHASVGNSDSWCIEEQNPS